MSVELKNFLLYRDLIKQENSTINEMSIVLNHMILISEQYTTTNSKETVKPVLLDVMSQLFVFATERGYHGNLWHCFLADYLVNHENSFSLSCERRGSHGGTIEEAALHDFQEFMHLYALDLSVIGRFLDIDHMDFILSYQGEVGKSKVYNTLIQESIYQLGKQLSLAGTNQEFLRLLSDFYKQYGVGKFGLHKAFRLEQDSIDPILNISKVTLDDLIGYEQAKKKLLDNTEAFVQYKKANNCLLYGDAGTGKSSSMKAIVNQYYDQGLRIIELYKHQFHQLNQVISQIKNRNYRFIIYMDDLSFEDFEIEYKYLKAVIEGGLEKKPENILMYATTNRRHLVREKFSDKEERRDDLHPSDTVSEKLSLVARFGVTIFYCAPDKKEFQDIVLKLAKRNQIPIPEDELLLRANQWEMNHGGKSGRTAQQFIDYLSGQIS